MRPAHVPSAASGEERANILLLACCTQEERWREAARDRPHDGKILHNDWSIGQLAGKLRQLGILDNTLIIVVSDHGEEFWEHGWTGHGQSLYQELAHGVLLMWNPKLIPTARRIVEPVQLIDVMPSVLDSRRKSECWAISPGRDGGPNGSSFGGSCHEPSRSIPMASREDRWRFFRYRACERA